MKVKQTVSALVLAAVLPAVVLAGCGSKSEPAKNGSAAGDGGKPAAAHKISFLLVNPTIKDFFSVSQTKDNEYVKELKKLSGYDLSFEFLPGGEETNKQLAIRFAAADLPDVIRTTDINATVHAGAVEQGAFLDLTPLIDKYAPNLKKAIPESVWKSPMVSKNGKIYAIPAMWPNPDTRVIYYRKDWLAKAGMSEPKTIDDWVKFFEYVKNNDMNGDGVKDEVGFAFREQMSYSDLFFGSFGVHPNMWTMQDSQFVPSMITPKMKDAVTFWKMLYDKGYVNKNMFTNKAGDWDALIRSNKAAAWLHDAGNYQSWNSAFTKEPTDTSILGVAPAPVGPNGDSFLRGQKLGIYYVNVIPSKVKNPEEIVKYFEWAYTNKQAADFFHYGIENVNYKKVDGKVTFDGVPKPLPGLKDNENQIFQLLLNARGVGYEDPEVLALSPVGATVQDAFAKAKKSAVKDDTANLPTLGLMTQKPELQAATTTGTLFMDMFAKALTGKESVDTAFDNFVSEWKKRGGDQLIKEATEWHKSFYGK
ncbi:extracellular solute-binding protein [Paenibacillus hodogayensis]|uniref:Extracellular solute-binding protein n=1 Tax=Paenibacillus hodogayensis TaxID=279208 RepID=A0ABV5VTH8_9BACL